MYASIISLGAWCQVAEQLRMHKVPRTQSPFEWTVAPWQAMVDVLRDDGQQLCHVLAIEGEGTGQRVMCQTYGLMHPHDVPHVNGLPVSEPTPEQIELAKGKYAHKMRAFRQACRSPEGRLLFIRMGGEASPAELWPYLFDQQPLKASRVNSLVEDLKQYCGHDNFDLAVVLQEIWHPFEEDVALAPNVRMIHLPVPTPPVDWYGKPSTWDDILDAVGVPYETRSQNSEASGTLSE